MARGSLPRSRRSAPAARRGTAAALAVVASSALALLVSPSAPLFATVSAPRRALGSSQATALCGRSLAARRDAAAATGAAAVATAQQLGWFDMRRWSNTPVSPSERLSPREWTRMYRILGLEEGSSRDKITKAVSKLRKKYANNEEALERVENANLWIMTKLLSQKEDAMRKQQQANRLRELGDSPRKLFVKYVAGYLPPSIRQMFEAPTTKHFRTASGLIGVFALVGLCVPTQASNFVGLAGAATMGLVYQRNRPEPVKDDMGNVGEVRKINYKEAGATIVVTILGALLGMGISAGVTYLSEDAPFQSVFCLTTCFVLWVVSLFCKVYQCFDQ